MARPKRLQEPSKLTIVLEKKVKELAREIANHRNMSIGQFLTQMVLDEIQKGERKTSPKSPKSS